MVLTFEKAHKWGEPSALHLYFTFLDSPCLCVSVVRKPVSTEPSGLRIGDVSAAEPQLAQFRSRKAWRTDFGAWRSRDQIPIQTRGDFHEPYPIVLVVVLVLVLD